MNKIVIIFLLIVFIDGLFKRCSMFELFIDGVKDALTLLKPIFTTLMAFMLFVQLIQSLHLPIDIFILGFLRPISANASLSFLYSFYEVFGVDHPLSLLASLIQSGSDTTMYVVALYFSSIKMKDTRYALWVGLTMDFLSVVFAIMIYLKMFV